MNELRTMRTVDLEGAARAASANLAARAARSGLVDVAFATVDSPVGELLLARTPQGLARVAYDNEGGWSAVLEELAGDLSPRILERTKALEPVRRQLDEYFGGRRRQFSVPIDLSLVRGFTTKVLEVTAKIPFGAVSSYGRVAAMAGSPRAARAAGNALHVNPIPIVVPCHRVIHADGGLGGYGGRLDRKEFLLRLEGAL